MIENKKISANVQLDEIKVGVWGPTRMCNSRQPPGCPATFLPWWGLLSYLRLLAEKAAGADELRERPGQRQERIRRSARELPALRLLDVEHPGVVAVDQLGVAAVEPVGVGAAERQVEAGRAAAVGSAEVGVDSIALRVSHELGLVPGHRHRPEAEARRPDRAREREQVLEPGQVGVAAAAEQRGPTTERRDRRSREGGEVEDDLRVEGLHAVVDPVAEHEPTFGIAVVDLDQLFAAGADDVAGEGTVAVLGAVGHQDDVAVLTDREHEELEQGGGVGHAHHVHVHLVHRGAGLAVEAAGVVGDALADDHELLGALLAAAVLREDAVRRVLGAIRDGQERSEATAVAGATSFVEVGVEHGHRDADEIVEEIRSSRGQDFGGAFAAAQIAGSTHPVSELRRADAEVGFLARDVTVAADEDRSREDLGLLGGEFRRALNSVVAQFPALHDQAGAVVERVGAVEVDGHVVRHLGVIAQPRAGRARRHAQPLGGELGAVTNADDQQLAAIGAGQDSDLVGLAGHDAILDDAVEGVVVGRADEEAEQRLNERVVSVLHRAGEGETGVGKAGLTSSISGHHESTIC